MENRIVLVPHVRRLGLYILLLCGAPAVGGGAPQPVDPTAIKADTRFGSVSQAVLPGPRFGTLDAGEYFIMASRKTPLLRVRGMIAVRVSAGSPGPQAVADGLNAAGAALDGFGLELGAPKNRTFVFEARGGVATKGAAAARVAAGDIASSNALAAAVEMDP